MKISEFRCNDGRPLGNGFKTYQEYATMLAESVIGLAVIAAITYLVRGSHAELGADFMSAAVLGVMSVASLLAFMATWCFSAMVCYWLIWLLSMAARAIIRIGQIIGDID